VGKQALTIYYFDADAQVKYLINELGSSWIRQVADELDADSQPAHDVATLEISRVEVSAAISIIHRMGRIGKRIREQALLSYGDFANTRIRLLAVDATMISEASGLATKYPLKALDALHIAAAIRLNRELAEEQLSLTLVSSDHQLLTAAEAEGLLTENPVDYDEND
jgi:predicted nucleic acid-binding protein